MLTFLVCLMFEAGSAGMLLKVKESPVNRDLVATKNLIETRRTMLKELDSWTDFLRGRNLSQSDPMDLLALMVSSFPSFTSQSRLARFFILSSYLD